MDQAASNDEKNGGQKSRWTAPLKEGRNIRTCSLYPFFSMKFYIITLCLLWDSNLSNPTSAGRNANTASPGPNIVILKIIFRSKNENTDKTDKKRPTQLACKGLKMS